MEQDVANLLAYAVGFVMASLAVQQRCCMAPSQTEHARLAGAP